MLLERGAAGAPLQRLAHFFGTAVALRRGESAGLQHDLLQRFAPVGGRGQRRAGKAALLCLLALHPGGNVGRQGKKRQRVPVHHPVEHHAQGINVHRCAVVLMVGYFRRHIAIAARQRAGALGYLRHPEIPQLEEPLVGHQDVFRLDVPVDDIFRMAGAQRIA